MTEKAILIFSGYNDRAVLSFCRFAEVNKLDYYLVSKNSQDLIYKSIYSKKVILQRENQNLNLDLVQKACSLIRNTSEKKEIIILPSSEFLNRFFLKNRDKLIQLHVDIALCDKKIYEDISDKYSFVKICQLFNLKVPKEQEINQIRFPVVIKPKTYFSSDGNIYKPSILNSKIDLEEYLKNKDLNDFFFQEYIKGKSIYYLYYVKKNGEYKVFGQKNLMQQPNGGSIVLAESICLDKDFTSKVYGKLFLDLKFYGLIMVELRVVQNEKYMIEANPRLWGPSQLILDAKMSLFECFSEDFIVSKPEKSNSFQSQQFYFWGKGIDKNDLSNYLFYEINEDWFLKNENELSKFDLYNKKDIID